MNGRRIPVPEDGHAWAAVTVPGDYCGPTGDEQSVWFLLPCARDADVPPECRSVLRVASPPHTYRECADGSLEIRASIAVLRPDGSHAWHGYLDEGNVWRVC